MARASETVIGLGYAESMPFGQGRDPVSFCRVFLAIVSCMCRIFRQTSVYNSLTVRDSPVKENRQSGNGIAKLVASVTKTRSAPAWIGFILDYVSASFWDHAVTC